MRLSETQKEHVKGGYSGIKTRRENSAVRGIASSFSFPFLVHAPSKTARIEGRGGVTERVSGGFFISFKTAANRAQSTATNGVRGWESNMSLLPYS